MPKYKVLKPWRNKETGKTYQAGQIVELPKERADRAITNLKQWPGEFIRLIETDNKSSKKNIKEEKD